MSTAPRSDTFDLHGAAMRAMSENGFAPRFEPDVEREASALRDVAATTAASEKVRDLCALPWSSIDNRESRDLDQIEAVEKLPNGDVKVMVAIADVDALVPKGSAIDAHAAASTTSVYTGSEIFPMLPETLSTDLTSLVAGRARLAIVTEMIVAADGSIGHGDVYRALVTNHAKLAYDDVAPWLEGRGPEPQPIRGSRELEEQLRVQSDVAERLRRVRVAHGALDLETIEASPVAKDGVIVDLRVTQKSLSRQLIEDLMIAANGVVARWLDGHGRSALRRIVRTPKRWDRIVALAGTFGDALPVAPDSVALSAFLTKRRAADPARFADLSLAIVKLMGPGEYALDRPGDVQGHFGLAVGDYTHSTAPNRRFADLVTQRITKAALAGTAPPYSDDELTTIAARCTEREHGAQKVERTMRKIGAALFLRGRVGETFDGIVTGVTPKGTFVRLLAPAAEGRVVRGEAGVDVGDQIRVELVATDPSKGFIDFARAVR